MQYAIKERKNWVCFQLHGQVSKPPMYRLSAMIDPKGKAFCFGSGSLLDRNWNQLQNLLQEKIV